MYSVNEIVKNVDTGWDSFYMYKDAGGKLCFGPVWDFDIALGNANCDYSCSKDCFYYICRSRKSW